MNTTELAGDILLCSTVAAWSLSMLSLAFWLAAEPWLEVQRKIKNRPH